MSSTMVAAGLSMARPLTGDGVDPGDVGGKAAALDRLVASGLPVPVCGVVTADAYRTVTADDALSSLLDELRDAPLPEPEAMDAEVRRVDEAFARVDVPSAVERAIVELARQIAGDGGRLAVRSSATVEDGGGASFAGQFRSLLDVEAGDVLEAVRQVWASLWHPAPRAYRHARKVDEADLAMAVVVMRMVPATYAGVAFTVDPEGDVGSVRVERVAGLGEKLVSGSVTPERMLVPRQGDTGLDVDEMVLEVRDLALRCEAVLGSPQDVEWAAASDGVYVVQSRPITVTAGGASTEPTWTPVPVEEMAPGVVSPLLWSVNGFVLEEGFRHLFDQLGVELPDGPIVGRFDGRVAANLDALADAVSSLPGGSRGELERQYFGWQAAGEDEGRRSPASTRLIASVRAARLRRRLARETATVRLAVDLVIDAEVRVEALDAEALVAYRRRVHDLLLRVVAAQVATAANAVAAYRALENYLVRFVGDDAPAVAQRLTAGAIHADGQRALDVTAVIEDAGADGLRAALLDADDLEAFQRRLEAQDSGEAILDGLARARRRAGSTAIPGGPTWEEQDDLTLDALRADRTDGGRDTPDPAEALAAFAHELSSTWRWRLQRLLTGQVVDVRCRFLGRLVGDATRLLAHREQLKLIALRLGGESRRTAQRAAALLHGAGRLSVLGDVELLTDVELLEALTGGTLPADLASRRCAHHRHVDAERLPIAFIGDPSRPAPHSETAVDAQAGGEGDVLSGWAASAGRHRGAAVVVDEAASSSLQEGDVLVAHATDPSWTPLFVRAGAIVVEEGGPLSHAAIVARELGKPAVLNVPGVVERLRDVGAEVTVDGTAGTVVVHEVAP